jgi:pimeloyl-ACP methyl ester carboxylesterase
LLHINNGGFCRSKTTTKSFKNWETSIASYIKENKIDKPIIIGHSMGGGLALASDYPELIENYYCRCASLPA